MNDNILELAKKLNALAERGEGGEKANAQDRLKFIMEKYGVTFEMLEENKKSRFEFKATKENFKFYNQVISSVCGNIDTFYYRNEINKVNRTIIAEVTELEYIEIIEKFQFYWKKYQEDPALFYSAFVQKNHLYAKTTDKDEDSEEEVTKEEIMRIMKLRKMMQGIDHHTYLKTLAND